MPTTPEAPRTPPKRQLTRDQRNSILTLHEGQRHSIKDIANQMQCSYRQVQYTIQQGTVTPSKRSGRRSILSDAHVNRAITWIQASSEHRETPYETIVQILELPCCGDTFRRALDTRGFQRHPAVYRPPLGAGIRTGRCNSVRPTTVEAETQITGPPWSTLHFTGHSQNYPIKEWSCC